MIPQPVIPRRWRQPESSRARPALRRQGPPGVRLLFVAVALVGLTVSLLPGRPRSVSAAVRGGGLAPGGGVDGAEIAASPRQRSGRPRTAQRLEFDAERAINRALEYLASHQNSDGSWTDKIGRKVHFEYRGREGRHVGVTALAGMAFLANGSLPGRGRYGDQIERALDFILKHVDLNGFVTHDGSRMYSHAFATLFLAEVYGMTGMEAVGDRLKRAISLICEAQNPAGGWRYQPGASDADMSITVCQVMALRAAHNAGIHVQKGVIDRAIDYVKHSYNRRQGAFNYQIEELPDGRRQASRYSFALTAAGVTALFGAGVYDGPQIDNGLRYLRRELSHFSHNPEGRFDYFYGMYYGTQAAFQRGGAYWDEWRARVWPDLLRLQHATGYWRDLVGKNYGTAMACVILQIPFQYLPIFER